MFTEKEKVVKYSKGSLERIKYLEEKYTKMGTNLIASYIKLP